MLEGFFEDPAQPVDETPVEGVDRTKLDLLQEQLELLNGIVPQNDVQL